MHYSLRVEDPSQVGDARRRMLVLCRSLDLTDSESGQLGLVVTELATNLVKHARSGELVVLADANEGIQIDILSIDRGPGMGSVAKSMQDGFSTAGSPGTGLGSIFRNSVYMDIHSETGKGTVILSRFRRPSSTDSPSAGQRLEIGGICLPVAGEEECGDGWASHQTERHCLVFVSDGLGHGPDAAAATREAISLFEKNKALPPVAIAEAVHAGLRSTRGGVMAVARIEKSEGLVRYSGIGNISGSIITGDETRNMVSENGTAGYSVRKIRDYDYPWLERSILVLHSDGLSARWKLEEYSNLTSRHPLVIAAVLFRDHRRERDDATVVVAKRMPAGFMEDARRRFSPRGPDGGPS
jgi:anti-sigma regulatory factor (Ser/Thr protein kinase)